MGSGASRTILEAEVTKPVDASDIADLDAAKAEISRMRNVLRDQLNDSQTSSVLQASKAKDAAGAGAKPVARRGEVSAEVMGAAASAGAYQKKVVPKDDASTALIRARVNDSILFQNLGEEAKQDCVDAFFKVEANSGDVIIRQGDQGDNFYVVQTGTLDIHVATGNDAPVRCGQVEVGGSFGELALLYNTPRAATITATADCVLWALDRSTFRAISQHFQQVAKTAYMEFLRNVPSLSSLSTRELAQMADAMEEEIFEENAVIIRQGEIGNHFYVIAEGSVSVLQAEGEAAPREVGVLSTGDYFGERALLTEETRNSTCVAKGGRVRTLSMGREAFTEMLGSLSDLIKRAPPPPAEAAADAGDPNAHPYFRDVRFEDLEMLATLGCGAFGRVKLVKHRESGDTFALKCLGKADIVQNNLQDHVVNERNVMLQLDHPFILKLHNTYKDDRYIYFLLELALGGEMFTFLRKAGRFNESASRFYAASVVLGFQEMHGKNIIYRDLKPENLILDAQGFLKVVDFGLAKVVTDRTWTLCGTPDYLAPEIILSKGHDRAVDYWALGVLIYEMTAGFVPFYSDDPMEVYQLILADDVRFPSHFSRGCADLISKLLHSNQSKRLGNMKGGIRDIVKHKWFSGFDWEGLLGQTMEPPIVPVVSSPEDISNFDEYPEEDEDAPVCAIWEPAL